MTFVIVDADVLITILEKEMFVPVMLVMQLILLMMQSFVLISFSYCLSVAGTSFIWNNRATYVTAAVLFLFMSVSCWWCNFVAEDLLYSIIVPFNTL